MQLNEQEKVAIVHRAWNLLLEGLGHPNSVDLLDDDIRQTMDDLCTAEGWRDDMPSLRQYVFPLIFFCAISNFIIRYLWRLYKQKTSLQLRKGIGIPVLIH